MYQNQPFGNGAFGNVYGAGNYMYNGMQPNQMPPTPKNALTNEEIQSLMKNNNVLSIELTPEEALRAGCTHWFDDGRPSLTSNNDGTVTCTICGATFMPFSQDDDPAEIKQNVKDIVQGVVDVLQTLKQLYIDMPAESVKKYFILIPMLQKLPDLYEQGLKDYRKNNPGNENMNFYNNSNSVSIGMLKSIIGGGFYNQQPAYNPYGQQPYGYNNAGMYQQPNGFYGQQPQQQNPFGYNAQPMNQPQQYTANNQNFTYTPQQNNSGSTPAATPQTPAANSEKVNVQSTFKA